MKILALDTALGACSVAVLDDAAVLAHRWVAMERGHAEALAPMVDEVVRASGVAFADFDRLAVTTGPGTFTGQRVGLAFARGLRVALKKPLIGLTTLESMAAAAAAETGISRIAVLHDARREEVYLEIIADGVSIFPPSVLALSSVTDAIAKHVQHGPLALAGTGAHLINLDSFSKPTLSTITQPDALWLARLALLKTADDSVPATLYLRAPDAKLPAAR